MTVGRKAVLVGALVAGVSVVGQAAAAPPAGPSVVCSLHAKLTSGQISNRGAMFGTVSCDRPFGKGSYHGRYRDHVVPFPFIGSETGTSRLSFKDGALRGTYTVEQAPVAGTAPFHGSFQITGGSGRFKHVRGTLILLCVHHVPPLTDCTLSGPVKPV